MAEKNGSTSGEHAGESYNASTLQQIIAAYKANFHRIDDEERYKWEALGHYKQQHWNIDAPDFAEQYREAYLWAGKRYKRPKDGKWDGGNLLTYQNHDDYNLMIDFAKHDPETVRELFRTLYDETSSLDQRYKTFYDGCDRLLKEKRKREPNDAAGKQKRAQDLHTISIYLTFEHPEQYYIYKYDAYEAFRKLIDFPKAKDGSDIAKLENYNRMCEVVLKAVKADEKLLAMSRDRLNGDCYKKFGFYPYQDSDHHLLVSDVIYFCRNIDKEKLYMMNDAHTAQPGHGPEIEKNMILYGPPGTGKTYHTVLYAVAIVESKPLTEIEKEPYAAVMERFKQYRADNLIEFTTFHQSYGYEEFIEGIKPAMETDDADGGDIEYRIKDGLFKEFCERASRSITQETMHAVGLNSAPTVWKVSLYGTGDNPVRAECLQNGHIRIGWDEYGADLTDNCVYKNGGKAILNAFINKMKVGDIVLSCYSSTTIDAIGVVTGDYEWREFPDGFNRVRNVNWLAKDIRENIVELNNGVTLTLSTVYKLNISAADAMGLAMQYRPDLQPSQRNYVFIIDEINRGNISKILGELITLIEPSKRIGQPEGLTARLPYSQKPFGVPDNVYLLGTMNTADRSIATIDTALRRRFQFEEMQPDPSVLKGIEVAGISISQLLSDMNQKISVLYDREHTIGHSYFLPLKSNPTIETLAHIFENSILPLLQEYFYDDYAKIRLVLGDNKKPDASTQFITETSKKPKDLFGNTQLDLDDFVLYEINPDAFKKADAYRSILIAQDTPTTSTLSD